MKEMIRVLIADDSAAFGKACQKELKSGGFDCVLTQKDGNRVISLLDTQHFDVVVMDVFMSGADAMEVLEHMEPMAEKPLVLLLSSMDTPEFEEQMIRAGADYMLIKPVRPQSVAHRISRLSQWKAKSKNPRSADVQGADLDLIISDIMRQIGVPAHIKGYQYLPLGHQAVRGGPGDDEQRDKAAVSYGSQDARHDCLSGGAGNPPRH